MDTTVYFKTLRSYRCNPGILIAAEEGEDVLAAYEGVVESVSEDKEHGTTVTVIMGNGYKKSLTPKECSILTWDAFQSYMKSILDKETKISDWQEGYIGVPSKLPYNAITQKEYSECDA